MSEDTFSKIRIGLFIAGIVILFAVARKLVYSNSQDW
jgi:hypothetical protein